jgi:hypothetical protein
MENKVGNMSYIPLERISITDNGIEYFASFRVADKMLEVHTSGIIKKTQLGGMDPEALAKIMLSEIVKAGEYKL